MAEVLAKKVRVRAHVHSATDVMTLLRLKDEFGFDLTLHHSTEAYKVADEVAKRGVSAVVLPLGDRIGITDDAMKGPYILWKAGVKIAMHTDHPVINQKWLRLSAGLAMRYGLPEDEALKAITINVAEIQGVADRVGSITVGKDADFVVMNGPWYEPRIAGGPRRRRRGGDLRPLDGGEVIMRPNRIAADARGARRRGQRGARRPVRRAGARHRDSRRNGACRWTARRSRTRPWSCRAGRSPRWGRTFDPRRAPR